MPTSQNTIKLRLTHMKIKNSKKIKLIPVVYIRLRIYAVQGIITNIRKC
ncbi:MAG: hypothetical protein ACI88A_004735 [Paraglaciecola sp.]|jgi:hypothetical protein